MRETIYTIPINDVFVPKCGCPICLMRDMLEKRCIEYIIGAAMMEPDIRIETNKYGFCSEHFSMLSAQKKKLALSLMLESHIEEIIKNHTPPNIKNDKKSITDSCFVCNEIDSAMDKLISTAVKLFFADSSFKKLFCEQEYYCYPHYELLLKKGSSILSKKEFKIFSTELTNLTQSYMDKLKENIHAFTTMFDYRNSGKTEFSDEVKQSVETAIKFLTSR